MNLYAHLSLNMRAPVKLAKLRAYANKPQGWARPMTWRDVRFTTHRSDNTLRPGGPGEYYSSRGGPEFSREKFSSEHETARRGQFPGYYIDPVHGDTARGIIVALPHGRFLAGYYSGDERVYSAVVYDDVSEALRESDRMARVFAEKEFEYRSGDREVSDLEDKRDTCFEKLSTLWPARHVSPKLRDMVYSLIDSARAARNAANGARESFNRQWGA